MNESKMKLARIVGIVFVVLGLAYWIVSFFLPNTYSNEKPDSDAVYSTRVISKEDAENANPSTSKPLASTPSPAPRPANPEQVPNDVRNVPDPLAPQNEQVPVPEGLHSP